MINIIEKMDTLHTDANKTAVRAFANTCLASAIGKISKHLKNEQRKVRNPNAAERNEISRRKNEIVTATGDLDTRNAFDEHDRGDEHQDRVAEEFGFQKTENVLQTAEILFGLYEKAKDDLNSMDISEYEGAMELSSMLDYMQKERPEPSFQTIKLLAEALRVSPDVIKQMKKVQAEDEAAKFAELRPAIEAHILGLAGSIVTGTKYVRDEDGEMLPVGALIRNGADRAHFDNLPILDRANITKKVAEKTTKAHVTLMKNIVRYELLSELGKMRILEAAAQELTEFSDEYHKYHRADLEAARGMNDE